MRYIIIGLVIIIAIIVTVLLIKNKKKSDDNSEKTSFARQPVRTMVQVGENIITPKEYNLGYYPEGERKQDCTPADSCQNKYLYPICGVKVESGVKIPEGSQCLQFIQPP
jgi:hypothetical protein